MKMFYIARNNVRKIVVILLLHLHPELVRCVVHVPVIIDVLEQLNEGIGEAGVICVIWVVLRLGQAGYLLHIILKPIFMLRPLVIIGQSKTKNGRQRAHLLVQRDQRDPQL